jgi:hypothetical protein
VVVASSTKPVLTAATAGGRSSLVWRRCPAEAEGALVAGAA